MQISKQHEHYEISKPKIYLKAVLYIRKTYPCGFNTCIPSVRTPSVRTPSVQSVRTGHHGWPTPIYVFLNCQNLFVV